jgi:hypothetical protein
MRYLTGISDIPSRYYRLDSIVNLTTLRSEMNDAKDLVERYVAVWNEPDAARRRQAVRELWGEEAVHVLQPPQEVREAAASLEVRAVFQVRGHAELEKRVERAYETFVAEGGKLFKPRDDGARVGDVAKFRWEMVTGGGEVAGVGLEFVILNPDGRIQADYQFIET